MKKLLFLLAILVACAAPSHADLIKQGATYNRDILVTDSTGANVNSLASGAFTVAQSQAGTAPAAVTPTITFKANGHYNVAYTSAMTATLGSSALVITASGAAQTDVGDQIVAFDPASATAFAGVTVTVNNDKTGYSLLTAAQTSLATATRQEMDANSTQLASIQGVTAKVGFTGTGPYTVNAVASNLPTEYLTTPEQTLLSHADVATSTRSTFAGGAVASVTAPVVASSVTGSVSGTVGGIAGTSFPTNFSLLAINGSGAITTSNPVNGGSAVTEASIWAYGSRALTDKAGFSLSGTQAFNNTGQTSAPPWLGVSSVLLTAEQAKLTATSTAQQAGSPVTLPTTAPTGYGGAGSAGDTSGVTTLLARIPGTVQPQTGDAYLRFSSPVVLPSTVLQSTDLTALAAAVAGIQTETTGGAETLVQTLRLIRAVLAGNSAVSGSSVVFKRKDGTAVALTISNDSLGNRSGSVPGPLGP